MITLHFNNKTLDVQESDSSYRYRAIMQKPQLFLKFSLPYWVDIPVGAWCEYMEERYYLNTAANIKKQGTRNIEYSLTMGTDEDKMSLYKLRNFVDKRLKFSMCAKPHEFVQEIVDNLNEKFGAEIWSVGECIDSTEKTIEFNHSYIDAALQSIAETFETEWEIVGKTIHLRKVEYFKDSPLPLSYGKGNGFIPGLGRTTPSGEQPIKRLYVQGGEQNIDRSKYGSAELLLPKGQTLEYEGRTYKTDAGGYYIERVDKISDAVKEDSLDCSEIYPSRVGAVSSVVAVKPEKNFYDFVDNSIPADLNFNDYIIEGETPFIRFQTGMLAGEKDFEFKYIHDERRFEIVPQEIDGQVMPNETYLMSAGDGTDEHPADTYAVFGIMLPDSYICNNEDKTGASWDMFREGAKHLYENEEQKFTFTGTLQGLYAKRNWLTIGGRLKMGGYILFSDEQFAKEGASIRITGIKDFLTSPYSPTLELSNSVSGSSVSSQLREIEKQEVVIEDVKKQVLSFTKRRFRDSKETIEMLGDALLENFTNGITPVSVQTMAMLVGDESLQFRFVEAFDNPIPIDFDIAYNQETNQLHCPSAVLQHMTLGINTLASVHNSGEYMMWEMDEYLSPVLTDGSKKYYLYAKVQPNSINTETGEYNHGSGYFLLSETAIGMNAESDYYHLLVGILNSEYDGERSFASMYGFTEILPGRLTTDKIISTDGKTYFDLVNGVIAGSIKFLNENNEYYTLVEGGKIKTEFLDVSEIVARSVIVGDENGKHVRIVPDEATGVGAVRIFDENLNECSVFEGEDYADVSELYSDDAGGDVELLARTVYQYGYASGITLGRGSATVSAILDDSSASDNDSFVISEVFKTNAPTEIFVILGHIRAYAYATGYSYIQNNNNLELKPMMMSGASAIIQVKVETYKTYDETTGELSDKISSNIIASASVSARATETVSPNGGFEGVFPDDSLDSGNNGIIKPNTQINGSSATTVTAASETKDSGYLNIADKKVRVPAGYHRIVMSIYLSASRIGSNARIEWGFTGGSRSDFAMKWLSDFYVSRYFANGFCLGTRADNYIIAYKTDEGMRFIMENNDVGFDFSKAGIRTRIKGNTWMPMPMLLYKAVYSYSNGAYVISGTTRTFNGDTLAATRSSKGLVTLTIPESWKKALETISADSLIVLVNGLSQTIDARVYSVSSTSILVAMSDDASLNDGVFSIIVYYLPS